MWSLRLKETAEIQASSQSPIFFRLVEDGDRRWQSYLGFSVTKTLVIWVSLRLGIPKTLQDPAFDDKTGENEVI